MRIGTRESRRIVRMTSSPSTRGRPVGGRGGRCSPGRLVLVEPAMGVGDPAVAGVVRRACGAVRAVALAAAPPGAAPAGAAAPAPASAEGEREQAEDAEQEEGEQ